jgi:ribosomal protein S18 acetylase RimI-like enzyme
VLTAAFLDDPLMRYLFTPSSTPYEECVRALMADAAGYRLAIGFPVLAVREHDGSLGAVCGVSPPGGVPPTPEVRAFDDRFRACVGPASSARYDEYARVAATNEPTAPHHYVGVLGTRADRRGRGYGRTLLDAAHQLAVADPTSTGVWLDTASPGNVRFYEQSGYEVRAANQLGNGSATIWGLFRMVDRRPT